MKTRTFPVTITREEIKQQSVRGKVIEPGYAWIRVSQFQERSVDDFAKKVDEIYKQDPKIKGMVLDLRNDPGGLLTCCCCDVGRIPARERDGGLHQWADTGEQTGAALPRHPIYMRLAGADALQELACGIEESATGRCLSMKVLPLPAKSWPVHYRITNAPPSMGSQSFGKGSVQTFRPLGPDTGLKITTSRYYTPSGRSIQAKGIVPDVMVDETEEGSPYAALRMREADLETHLSSGQGEEERRRP